MSNNRTLVLSAGNEPVRVAPWEDAIRLVMDGRAEVLEVYATQVATLPETLFDTYKDMLSMLNKIFEKDGVDSLMDDGIRIFMPAVIRLIRFFKRGIKKAKFSRVNLFTRDKFRCQYCGTKFAPNQAFKKLTYEHVIPRDQGGKTVWTNIVAACYPCNNKKANRTPEQAGMRLMMEPVKPKYLPITFHLRARGGVPDLWKKYLSWSGV